MYNNAKVFCPSCGSQMDAVAPVCPACGTRNPNAQPVAAQPAYAPMGFAPAQPDGKGMGIASMVLGILAVVFCCFWYIAIPLGIIGAALGGVAVSKAKASGIKNNMAIAGLVCSIISIAITIIVIIIAAIIAANAVNELNRYANLYRY